MPCVVCRECGVYNCSEKDRLECPVCGQCVTEKPVPGARTGYPLTSETTSFHAGEEVYYTTKTGSREHQGTIDSVLTIYVIRLTDKKVTIRNEEEISCVRANRPSRPAPDSGLLNGV